MDTAADLPPFPEGWFAVAFSPEIRAKKVTTTTFMGRDLVLWRTVTGAVTAAEAHCPHLGAHLGNSDVMANGDVRCPFHGFTFSPAGVCTGTPDGPPPKTARLEIVPVREMCGVILAHHSPARPFHHPAATAPAWASP